MNDAILLTTVPAELEKMVGEALRLSREGDLLALAELPLAGSSLLDAWYVGSAPQGSDERGRATQAMLSWLIERLRPSGTHSWTTLSWRPYNVLSAFYIAGRRIAEIAELMAVAEQTIYPIRAQAITALVKILREELARPAQLRDNYAIVDLYPQLRPDQQTLLRMLAIMRGPIALGLLYELARAAQIAQIEQHLQALTTGDLLTSDEQRTTYAVQAKLRPYLRTLLSPEERQTWHNLAGQHAASRADYLEAAIHLRLAGSYDRAAQLLIEHHRQIIDTLHSGELRNLLSEFRPSETSDPAMWLRLKLVSGDVAMTMNDVATALREYQQALGASEVQIKAEAYYKRGKAFRSQNTAEAQAHFAYCISLLEAAMPGDPLLYRVYLDQAWMLFQDRQDIVQAEHSLRRAAALIDPANRAAWAELSNAWGMYYSHQGQHAQAIIHHQAAWLAANETQDSTMQTHTAHNLGDSYMKIAQYDQALAYFGQSADLARKTGNRRMEGLCQKSIGACRFWLQQYEQAITHYQQAHAIFTSMQNRNWQANTCYDLAEAYAELGEVGQMQRYFAEAVALAQEAGLDRLLGDLSALTRAYAGLYPPTVPLNERQQLAYDHLKRHSAITNREYRDLTAVSPKQAARDLNELLEWGVLVRVGEGRSTAYRLAE